MRPGLLILCTAFVVAACGTPRAPDAPAAEAAVPTLTLAELRAKYTEPASRFVEVDGVELHYRDEGSGAPVVLLHASYMELSTWQGVAERLRAERRVVRFDFPNAGLSGGETRPIPEGRFDLTDRNVELLLGFADALGLERFALVGTSSGGIVAFRFAARHPERVERLVLINSAGMPRTPRTDPFRPRPEFAQWQKMPVKPRAYWESSMGENYILPHTPPPALVDRVYDFQRRDGLVEKLARDYVFRTGDPRAMLARVRAPTLIMWGLDNPVVMHLEADVIEHWMTGAPTLVRKYPGLGHYPYVEDLEAVYPDFAGFLRGDLDAELRRTARLRPGADCSE